MDYNELMKYAPLIDLSVCVGVLALIIGVTVYYMYRGNKKFEEQCAQRRAEEGNLIEIMRAERDKK